VTQPVGSRRIVVAAVAGLWEVRDDVGVLYWGPRLTRALAEARMHARGLGSGSIVVIDLDGQPLSEHQLDR
jgi:hypothetical protein